MSEPKAYRGDIYIPVYGSIADAQVYLKSEADKVIAEKNKEITELKEQVHEYALGSYVMQARAEKEARHHKYKRCLAMAKWCDAEADVADADGDYEDMRWYQKWHQKWLELAEKFKPNKSTAQQGKGKKQ